MTKSFKSNLNLLTAQWKQLKYNLDKGVVDFDNINKLINEYVFFRQFDNLIIETKYLFEVPLSDITTMYRGVSERVELNNYERMIPKVEYATGNNRMNPPGVAFLYLGIPEIRSRKDNAWKKENTVKTVLKEVRAVENTIVTICEFEIKEASKNKKVLNICGDSNIPIPNDELLFMAR